MKKHFLLLVMALMSMTAWAVDDLTGNPGVKVAAADIEYGQAAHAASGIRVTLDGVTIESTYYDLEYYETEDCSGSAVALNTLPVGTTRYVKVIFKGVYSGYAIGSFKVEKAVLKVKIASTVFTKTYKSTAANPTIAAGNITATVRAAEDAITVADYLDINYTKLNAYTFTGEDVNTDGYPITFASDAISFKEGVPADNYDLQIEPRNMMITPATIATGGAFAFSVVDNEHKAPVAGYDYTAAQQRPDYKIEWNHDGDAATDALPLVEGTDFEVKYFVNSKFSAASPAPNADNFAAGTYYTKSGTTYEKATTFATTATYYVEDDGGDEGAKLVDSPINAATYAVAVKGINNYTTVSDYGVTITDFGFTINKAPLTVLPLTQEKLYDGNATFPAAKFNIAGRKGADASKTVEGLTVKCTTTGGLDAAAGDYTMQAVATGATIGTGTAAIPLETNYTVDVDNTVKWTINPRPVTITVAEVTKAKTVTTYPTLAAIPTTAVAKAYNTDGDIVEENGVINEADLAKIPSCFELAYADGEGEALWNADADTPAPWTASALPIGSYENAIKVVKTSGLTDDALLAIQNNYSVSGFGTLKVSGTAFAIMPLIASEIQYGEDYTMDCYTTNSATVTKSKVVYEYYNAAGEKIEKPTARGEYTVKIDPESVEATGDFVNGEVTVFDGAFAIVKKPLTLTVNDATVHANDPITVTEGGNVFAGGSYTLAAGQKLVGEEQLTLTYSLDPTVVKIEGGRIVGYQTGKSAANPSILVELGTDAVSANYDITGYTHGKLTISDEYELTLGGEDTESVIAAAEANESKNVTVTFAENCFKMKKQEWYAVVLPFATSAKELVNKFDTYVVVNTLSANSTDQNFKFTLEMGNIPAGKPFIIKPAEALNWGEIIPEVPAVLYATLEDYNADHTGAEIDATAFAALTDAEKIKTAAIPAYPKYVFTGKEIDSEIHAYGVDGIVSIDGTYKATDILGVAEKASASTATIIDRVWWLSDTDYEASVTANDWRKPKSKAHPLKPMEAYLIAADGWTTYAPIITVEDFDGQTTAIKTLNADKINGLNVSEGWYNLNGVKLQSAPTQKGVYINNGKKVIIK